MQSAGLEGAFPTLEEKPAALAEGYIRAQAFIDANKPTGIPSGMRCHRTRPDR